MTNRVRIAMTFRVLSLAAVPTMLVAACPTTPPPAVQEDGFSCDGNVCIVSGPILTDTTLTADKKWVLKGGVFVGDDSDPTAAPSTLTIEPGTTVFGDTASLSFLLITRGSRIVAEGTRDAPIVFTSAGDSGTRGPGQWGGIIVNGQAPVNGCAGDPCTLQGEAGTGTYGGDDADDDSGVLKFIRIEFPGKLIDDENELNGLALQGVGRGTTVDFIQVHEAADDCIEFFGGTVNAKHIVCTGTGDDGVDWTFGWVGKAQFVVVQHHDGEGDRGIEADNNEDNFALTPYSNPVISNVTLIAGADNSSDGIKLRRGTRATIHNAVVSGFKKCVDLDDADTFSHGEAGDIVVRNSVFDCSDVYSVKSDDPATPEDESDPAEAAAVYAAVLDAAETGNVIASDVLAAPADRQNPDFRPRAGSLAETGAVIPADPFFDNVAFKGSMGTDIWTANWTAFPAD
jgi:hypothetical protein